MGLTNNVTVTFAPGLPGECTPSSLSDLTTRLTELVSSNISATGTTSFYNFGPATPSAANQGYPWLKTDASGYPIGWYVYNSGWRPVDPTHLWYAGSSSGAVNLYTATTVEEYPFTTFLVVGDVFEVAIHVTNTLASTLSINGIAAAEMTDGITALIAGQLVANKTYLVMWDGTRFRVLNPTLAIPDTSVSVSQFVYEVIATTGDISIPVGVNILQFNTPVIARSWVEGPTGGILTVNQPGKYQITAIVAIADVGATGGGSGQLVIYNDAEVVTWQDFRVNQVSCAFVVTAIGFLEVVAGSNAPISAQLHMSNGGNVYGGYTGATRAQRIASLTIMRFP